MKNILLILISSLLVGCSSTKETINNEKNFNITATIYPTYLLTKEITKGAKDITLNHLDIDTVGCLHDYSLSTSDMKKIEESDVLVINGAGMEESIEKAISNVENVIDASIGIELLENEEDSNEGHNHKEHSHEHNEEDNHEEHSHEHENNEEHSHSINSHIWLDIENAIKQSENIASDLIKLDSKNEAIYKENLQNIKSELSFLDKKFESELKDVKNKNIVTFHDSFLYLANAYNLNVVSSIQTEKEPTAKEIEEIIKEMKEHNVITIFVEKQYPQKTVDVIKNETHSNIYTLDSLVIKSEGSYIDRMTKNLKILKEALNEL